MSHVVEIESYINDLDALREACRELGGTFREHQKTYRWYGRWLGDYPLPTGVTREDLGKCDHAMSFPGASYEVGVVRTADGYRLQYDFYYAGGLHAKLGGQKAEKLVQRYNVVRGRKLLKKAGYRHVEEVTMPNGEIKHKIKAR